MFSNRKADASGSRNIIDAVSGEKAFEMIYDVRITEEQMRENGYPRPGNRNGMAKIYKSPPAAPNSQTDRYCRRCGKVFSLEHFDEVAVDECNYHPKSPGFRRGKFNVNFYFGVLSYSVIDVVVKMGTLWKIIPLR